MKLAAWLAAPLVVLLAAGFVYYWSFSRTESIGLKLTTAQGTAEVFGRLRRSSEGLNFEYTDQRTAVKIKGLEKKPDNLTIGVGSDTDNRIRTDLIYVGNAETFKNAEVTVKKNSAADRVNTLMTCRDENFDAKALACRSWEIAEAQIQDKGDRISFEASHFSAYAGAYLEILNVQSNLTQGDIWEVRFNTYSTSNLFIKAVDGTREDKDIAFEGLYCGQRKIADNAISKTGDTLFVKDYNCDGQTSKIRHRAVTAGRHWLSFSFGQTLGSKAHNFACTSGTLDTTCYVNSSQALGNNDEISGTGNLVIQNGGNLTSPAGNSFSIAMTGDVTIDSGGAIMGNLSNLAAANLTVNGTINANGKGFAGGTATGTPTAGGGTGGGKAVSAGQYVRAIQVTNNTGSVLTDYAVKITINTNALTPHMRTDCADMRWFDSDQSTPLNYFVESGCNTASTVIWVKVPSIGASASKNIYLTYGSSLPSRSDATKVFSFYDPFDNLNNWTGATSYYSVAGGQLNEPTAENGVIRNINSTFSWQYGIMEYSLRGYGFCTTSNCTSTVRRVYVTAQSTSPNVDMYENQIYYTGGHQPIARSYAYTTVVLYTEPMTTDWTMYGIAFAPGSTTATYFLNGNPVLNRTGAPTNSSIKISLGNYDVMDWLYIDWIRVRPWVATEPTHGAIGAESANSINLADAGGGGGAYGNSSGSGAYDGVSSNTGNVAYGSQSNPVDFGSGGAAAGYGANAKTGGNGGGLIKLTIPGTLTINGTITANGTAGGTGGAYGAGGGSGGSINILAGTVISTGGTPAITAGGGAGGSSTGTNQGGGGSGGRIVVYWTTDKTYTGTVAAAGGAAGGGVAGAGLAGTIIQQALPTTAIDAICSTPGNNCTGSGILAVPQESYGVAGFAGTAATPVGTNLTGIEMSIKDTDGSVNKWYNTANNSFDQATQAYFPITGTASWSYGTSSVVWQIGHVYQIDVRAANDAGNTGMPSSKLFKFVNSPPTVTNVTASENLGGRGAVTLNYDVNDLESSAVKIYAAYDVGTTLNQTLTAGETGTIAFSNGTFLPASGTVMIDEEMITYSAKAGSNLSGTITRGAYQTTGVSHSSGTKIWVMAQSVTGDATVAGSTVAKGTSKQIIWNAATDVPNLSMNNSSVRVVANDQAASSNVGYLASSQFILDTQSPAVGIPTGGGSAINVNSNVLTSKNADKTNNAAVTLNLSASDFSAFSVYLAESSINLTSAGNKHAYADTISYTLSSGDGQKTVYAQFEDVYGNLSATYSDTITLDTQAPAKPTNVFIQNASNANTSEWRNFFTWSKNVELDWTQYQVYREDDLPTADAPLQNINDANLNYILDQSLTEGVAYAYHVRSVDDIGNYTDFSDVMTMTAGGNPTDNVAPAITSITKSAPTTSSVSISWVTDEVSSTTVLYSIDGSYSNNAGVSGYVLNHSITLVGLAPDTLYNFKVQSCDSSHNCTTSDPDSFATAVPDTAVPVIDNVQTPQITARSVVITWHTDKASSSFVEYSTTNNFSSGTLYGVYDFTQNHTLTLPAVLQPLTTYYFKVHSKDSSGNEGISDQYSFLTLADPDDTLAPVLSGVAVSGISANTATITWTTNEPATSFVEFGQTRAYGRTAGNYAETTSHSVTLPEDLFAESEYNYRVRSMDAAGNESVSDNYTFNTSASAGDVTPPQISAVNIGEPTATSVTISWTTDEDSNSYVDFSFDRSYFLSQGSPLMTSSHSLTLIGLTPSKQYYFRIKSTDPSGNIQTDDNSGVGYTFATAASVGAPPIITNVQIVDVKYNTASISWTTNNQASDSFVEFGFDTSYGRVAGNLTLMNSHLVNLPQDLLGEVTYHFRVRSTDAFKNTSVSDDLTFTTPASPAVTVAEDTTAPVITAVAPMLVSTDSAVISWKTDEPATSQVFYGTSVAYGSNSSEDPVLTASHAVKLAGLSEATTYFFKVTSKDKALNEATNDNFSSGYTFTTLSSVPPAGGGSTIILDNSDKLPPIITQVGVTDITDTSAKISWLTDEVANGTVKYGESSTYSAGQTGNADSYTKAHSVTITKLKPGTKYHFKISSADIYNNIGYANDDTFTTSGAPSTPPQEEPVEEQPQPEPEQPVEPPVVPEKPLTSEEQMKIETIVDATKTGSQSFLNSAFQAFVNAISINPNISSMDESKFISSINEIAPKVVAAPVISGSDVVVQAGPTWAIISWITDKKSNSMVGLVNDADYRADKADPYLIKLGNPEEQVTEHQVRVDNLAPSTKYHYSVQSKPQIGEWSKSRDYVFTTQSERAEISDFRFDAIGETSVKISWKSSLPTRTKIQVIDAKTGEVSDQEDPSLIKEHSLIINKLKPANSYNIRMVSYDESGTAAQSAVMPFSTVVSANPPEISNVRVNTSMIEGKIEKVQSIITWQTDKPSTSRLLYEEGISKNSELALATPLDPALATDHIVISTSLKPGKVYRFRVESADAFGSKSYSRDFTILTPKPKETVIDLILRNFQDTFGFLNRK
ncbi:MAG: DUF2341 domain-containing protein [Candidatus Saccharibacteria bacterium]